MRDLKDSARESGNEEAAAYWIKLLCKQKIKDHFIRLNTVFYMKTKKKKAEENVKSFAEKGTSEEG